MTVTEAASFYGVSRSTIYRWLRKPHGKVRGEKVDGRWHVYSGAERKAVERREREPMDWHPSVHRGYAEGDGRKPEDFQFEKWPVSNVRLEASTTRHAPFWYACDIAPGTPLDNQYVPDKSAQGGYRKLPDPVGMCLQSVQFRLREVDASRSLDEQGSLPSEGKVQGPPSNKCNLWNYLTPDTSIKVTLTAFPRFYFLAEDGGMQGQYAAGNQGHFHGAEIESKVYTLSMDHDGNVSVADE